MSGEATSLFQQAMDLPADERYLLAVQLFESTSDKVIPEPPDSFSAEAEAETAWQEELKRRMEVVESHPEQLQSVEDAVAEIRAIRAARRTP